MQNPKKANHEATRSYLELWQCFNGTDKGVWSLQLMGLENGKAVAPAFEKANFKTKSGSHKSPIRFAIEDFLYVPLRDGAVRDDSLENKFAEYESQMIDLCRAATTGTSGGMKNYNIEKGLLGCLTHAMRDSFGWDALHSRIQNTVVTNRASEFEPQAHQKLVANAQRFIDEYATLVRSWEWTILWNLPNSLLICDRPCWDLRFTKSPENVIFMPLSPSTLLMGVPATDVCAVPGSLSFVDAKGTPKKTTDKWNHMTVERARNWIVGDSVAALNSAMPMFTQQLYSDRLATDTMRIRHSV